MAIFKNIENGIKKVRFVDMPILYVNNYTKS